MSTPEPYRDMRWERKPGEGLLFDEKYRHAQLPLVAPNHPRVIGRHPESDYVNGRYEKARVSLVADLGREFLQNTSCQTLLDSLSASTFSQKVAHGLIQRRAANLHATLVGNASLTVETAAAVTAILASSKPLRPRVYGPFIGRINLGRIYLPLHFAAPEDIATLDALNAVFERSRPTVVLVGLVNLVDELNADEASELAHIVSEQAGITSAHRVTALSWTSTHDDLTLHMQRLETLTLTEEN